MNKLLAMQVFARLAETGSFTTAAASLRVPRGTATKLVQQLERHLHLTLVQRTTRRVVITPSGSSYYERVAPLLREIEELEQSIGHAQKSAHGTLRVEAPAAFSQVVMIPQLPAFMARHPGLHLNLDISDRPIDLVGNGIDCVIRCGPLADSSLIARRVATLESVSCAAPPYIKLHGVPAHPRDLETHHHFIGYGGPETSRATAGGLVYSRRRERISVTPRSALTINESTTHLAAGLRGLGVFRAFRFMADPHLARGELVPVLEAWQTEKMPVYIVYPPTRHPSTRARAFIDWIAGLCAGGQ